MFNATVSTISRMFGASTSSLNTDRFRRDERDPLAGTSTEAGRSSEEANGHVSRRTSLDGHSDSTPLLTRKQSSRLSSSISTSAAPDIQYPGPPHVLWKAPHHPYSHLQRQSGQDSPTKSVSGMSMVITTPTTAGWGAAPMSRSASSPSLLLTPLLSTSASQPGHPRPSSLGRRSSRSIKLATDSMYASEDSDAESDRSLRNGTTGHTLPKQLSPIHEQQVPFPPHRKLSLDSVPRTPDSTRTFDRINGHNAFINRPLKRSLSQTSTSTHKSNISAAPPVIPPLDLRPNFQTVMGVQGPQGRLSPTGAAAPVPRKSRLAPPSLPTVIGSARQTNKVSVIYEDGASYGGPASARTSSFITAPSVSLNTPTAEPGQRFSFGELGPNVYLDPSSFASDSARGESMTTDADETPNATHPAQRLPAGLYDLSHGADEFGQMHTRPNSRTSLRPDNPTPPSTHSRSRNSSLTAPNTSALRTRSASPADESFLDRRWLKGLSFGSQRLVFPPSGEKEKRFSSAFILFCVGFIMPWCWLIGGWLLTSDGEVQEEERGSVLPLWHKRQTPPAKVVTERPLVKADGKGRADTDATAGKEVGEKKAKSSSWYPLVAPSLESLTPPNKDIRDTTPTRRLKGCFRCTRRTDPWIRKCRVAAAVSGILILAACVVAIVFAAGVHR
ncbi:hypothetical protein L226DRAFT_395861 [Lentinus tigrinus ALCF2SS1-7]|uniref:Uncharacterized protein n=1 Tax=Lentinus tigrinus ALCF2SS1-6 TaxID=1328759 RepID=A0A5C2SD20_9APHY|nr:hypothetical protein L227DRAFT_58260 [Lentinus tigrinus ALCF2SS1-6]RPD76066.1 hypothetical protein L226DRAFT_395861 [Lentinus tigrinus ALCF2SS1-7]